MKKIYALLFLAASCTNHTEPSNDNTDSSLIIDNSINVTVYDIVLKKDTSLQLFREKEDGSIIINEKGDTLYWLGGDIAGSGNYISSSEWNEYIIKKSKFLEE